MENKHYTNTNKSLTYFHERLAFNYKRDFPQLYQLLQLIFHSLVCGVRFVKLQQICAESAETHAKRTTQLCHILTPPIIPLYISTPNLHPFHQPIKHFQQCFQK
jgi:hypothetical protein